MRFAGACKKPPLLHPCALSFASTVHSSSVLAIPSASTGVNEDVITTSTVTCCIGITSTLSRPWMLIALWVADGKLDKQRLLAAACYCCITTSEITAETTGFGPLSPTERWPQGYARLLRFLSRSVLTSVGCGRAGISYREGGNALF